MTDKQPTSAVPDDVASDIEAVPLSVGTELREKRVHQGLSVDDISNRIKFSPRQIEALEADDFAHLPETAFLRGFVRSYARFLQLDPTPLLDALPRPPEQSVPQEAKALPEVPFDIYTERKQNIIWLSAALFIAVVLGLSAWLFADKLKGQNPPETIVSGTQNTTVETLVLPDAVPVSAVPIAEPVTLTPILEKPIPENASAVKPEAEATRKAVEVKPVPQASPAPVQPLVAPLSKPQAVTPIATNSTPSQAIIRMTFDADSWVEITDKNGKTLLSQLNRAGTEQGINGSPPFSLTIGYAKGVHLFYKGKSVDLAPHDIADVAHLTLE